LQIWDTAGQERYRSLIPTYLKNADCVIFVFDITNGKSLKNLGEWYRVFKENKEAPGILVGNKMDLLKGKCEEREEQKMMKVEKVEIE
jgi:small GTP-binding protein